MDMPERSAPNGDKTLSLFMGGKSHAVVMRCVKSGPEAGSILLEHMAQPEASPVGRAVLPAGKVRGGIFRAGDALDALGVEGFDSAWCDEGTGNGPVARESLFLTDGEGMWLIPRLHGFASLGGRPISVCPEGPFRPFPKEKVAAGQNACLARYQGGWTILIMTGVGRGKYCAMEADGDLEERFVLSAEDAQGARAVRERFEEIRPALFQVRVGGEWYWVDRCWADGKGMSVFGGRPVPEVTVTYPGRFETQWEVRRDQITEARVLLCRSILHDLFDI